MSPALYPPSRPQSIGEVLDSGFRIFSATLLRCLPIGVLAMVAQQLHNIYDILMRHPLHRFGSGDPLWWVLYGLGMFCGFGFINAILIRQATALTGSISSGRAALASGLRRAPAAAAVFLFLVLACLVWFLPLLGLPGEYTKWGIAVLAVPATYVGVLLSLAWAALIVAGKGIVRSLRYSAQIVRGNWWRTAAVYTVGFVMVFVFYGLAGVVAAILVPFAGTADIAVITAVSAVIAAALGAVCVPFYTALAIALFRDLEARHHAAEQQRQPAEAAVG